MTCHPTLNVTELKNYKLFNISTLSLSSWSKCMTSYPSRKVAAMFFEYCNLIRGELSLGTKSSSLIRLFPIRVPFTTASPLYSGLLVGSTGEAGTSWGKGEQSI